MRRLILVLSLLILIPSIGCAFTPIEWNSIKGKPFLDVRDYGANGDDTIDDATAIQATIVAAENAGIPVFIPPGSFRVDTPLIVTKPIEISGAGNFSKDGSGSITALYAGAVIDSIIDIGSISRVKIKNLQLQGASKATYGLKSAASHMKCESIWALGTLSAGFYVNNSWCVDFEQCEASYNSEDGFLVGNDVNNCNLTSCRSFLNSGFGFKVSGCIRVSFYGSMAENCLKGGIWLGPGYGYTIDDVYFEGCGGTGFNYDYPASYTVHADIIMHGSGPATTIAHAYPPEAVSVRNCYTSSAASNASVTSFIFGSFNNLVVEGNTCDISATSSPYIMQTYANVPYLITYPQNTYIGINTGFRNPTIANASNQHIYIDYQNFKQYGSRSHLPIPDVSNVSSYKLLSAGPGGGTLARSGTVNAIHHDLSAWEIAWDGSLGASNVWGITIDASKYPALYGYRMVFGIRKVASTGLSNIALVTSYGADTTTTMATTDYWEYAGVTFIFPSSGTLTLGVQAIGSSPACIISEPVLMYYGADYEDILRDTSPFNDYKMDATPSAGVWNLGDRVMNSDPAASEYVGWVCVASGTPGTWQGFGKIDP